jgi:amino acid adenylation domain-containing protein
MLSKLDDPSPTMAAPLVMPELEFGQDRVYWLEKLENCSSGARIPLDFARGEISDVERHDSSIAWDEGTTKRLLAVCGNKEMRVFALLIGAVEICLFRYGGAPDVVVGTTVPWCEPASSPKSPARLNGVLVLRDWLRGEMSVAEALESARNTLADACRHRRYPAWRKSARSAGTAALDFHPLLATVVLFEGITDRRHLPASPDVAIEFSLSGGVLRAKIDYRRKLFDPRTIDLFAAHLENAVRSILQSPLERLDAVELGRSRRAEPQLSSPGCRKTDGLVHEMFARMAIEHADRVAVRSTVEHVTYRQLDRTSNQLARWLRRQGVGRGSRVGIYLEPCADAVVAMLAVLKAGAAYVPLEPEHPPARARAILDDASVQLLLADTHCVGRLSGDLPIAALAAIRDEVSRESEDCLEAWASPDDVAYLMFTSGSTGRPKGVEVTHASLANYALSAKEAYFRRPAPAFALGSSLAFDMVVTSLWAPLVGGGSVVVLPRAKSEYPWDALVLDGGIDCLKLTPSHLSQAGGVALGASGVSVVVFGGEKLAPDVAARARVACGDAVVIIDEYGPTETTVGCIAHTFEPGDARRFELPIGRPFGGCRAYILSNLLRPCEPLEMGELYLGGPGVARGYIGRPDLTAARFLPDPGGTGERMYKSGDLARWASDGLIQFQGRSDGQVKFHGHRVELSELQMAMKGHPEVRDCRVRLLGPEGERVLVAYYVARRPLPPASLRAHLAETLVNETIPHLFCHLQRFPMTLNGKLDFDALPCLEDVRRAVGSARAPLETSTQRRLASLWAKLLRVDDFGADSHFFEMGGHSLLASQMLHMIKEAFGVSLPMRALFESPDLAGLAALVDQATEAAELAQLEEQERVLEQVEALSDEEVRRKMGAL